MIQFYKGKNRDEGVGLSTPSPCCPQRTSLQTSFGERSSQLLYRPHPCLRVNIRGRPRADEARRITILPLGTERSAG